MYDRINWLDGSLLCASDLRRQDDVINRTCARSNFLPYGMSVSILELRVDTSKLSDGLLVIKTLSLYTKDKYFISSHDTHRPLVCELSPNPVTSVFIHITEDITNTDDGTLISPAIRLSDSKDITAMESIKVVEILYDDNRFGIGSFSPPMLSCAHPAFQDILIDIKSMLSRLKLQEFVSNQAKGYALQVNLCQDNIRQKLEMLEDTPLMVLPIELYQEVRKFYALLSFILNKSPDVSKFNKEKPAESIKSLVTSINHMINKPVVKNHISLNLVNDIFIYENLPDAFINANEYYIVIKTTDDTFNMKNLKNEIKVSSLSTYKYTELMFLDGVKLQPTISKSLDFINDDDASIITCFKLLPGTEMDDILHQKCVVLNYPNRPKDANINVTIYYI